MLHSLTFVSIIVTKSSLLCEINILSSFYLKKGVKTLYVPRFKIKHEKDCVRILPSFSHLLVLTYSPNHFHLLLVLINLKRVPKRHNLRQFKILNRLTRLPNHNYVAIFIRFRLYIFLWLCNFVIAISTPSLTLFIVIITPFQSCFVFCKDCLFHFRA